MKIEFIDIEYIPTELEIPEPIKIDFSSLSKLKGNKIILEFIFQLIKNNKSTNGKES